MAYTTIALVKSNWLNITDNAADTQLTNLLASAERRIDRVMAQVKTVPLTGDNISNSIIDFTQELTAGLFWQANAKNVEDYNRGKDMEDRVLKAVAEYALQFTEDGFHVEVKEYETEPLSNE